MLADVPWRWEVVQHDFENRGRILAAAQDFGRWPSGDGGNSRAAAASLMFLADLNSHSRYLARGIRSFAAAHTSSALPTGLDAKNAADYRDSGKASSLG
jgi:hypothetical protein